MSRRGSSGIGPRALPAAPSLFFGVDMLAQDHEDSLVRVILDPRDGPLLKLNVPGTDKGLTVVQTAGCKRFDSDDTEVLVGGKHKSFGCIECFFYLCI